MFRFIKNIFRRDFDVLKKLPSKFPRDLKIEHFNGGGRRLDGLTIVLNENNSFLEDERGYAEFTMTRQEMEDVYSDLKAMNLHKVEMIEDLRLDFPSSKITIKWDRGEFLISTSQLYRVKENSPGNFYGGVYLIQNIGKEKTKSAVFKKISPY